MTSLQTQYKLADLLKAISEGEKQVEIVRQVLAEKPDFEPYAAFKRIDRSGSSLISTYDLLDFLREHEVIVLEKDIRNLLKEHKTHSNDKLSYTEFLDILLPKASSVLRQLCTQRESYPVGQDEVLPYEVEWALARVFEKEIDLITRAEILKQDLADQYDFDPHALYRCIDVNRGGLIDFDLLYIFFKSSSVPVSDVDILALLRRTDKDVDGKLTYSEFRKAVVSVNSPSAGASSPSRKSVSRGASPMKKSHSRKASSSFLGNSASSKLSNYKYLDYVQTSAEKAARSRSPSLGRTASPVRKTGTFDQSVKATSPVRKTNGFNQSIGASSPVRKTGVFDQSVKATSPVRNSMTKRLQEANKEEMDRSLRESIRANSPVRNSNIFEQSVGASSPVRKTNGFNQSIGASSPVRKTGAFDQSVKATSPVRDSVTKRLQDAQREEMDRSLRESIRANSPVRNSNSFNQSIGGSSPARKTSTFDQSVRATSPIRDSVTKRLQDAQREEMDRSLRESMRASLYRTPTKSVASPNRSQVLSPARSPVRSPTRSPVRESAYSSPSRRNNLSPMKGNEEEHLANALKEQIELDKDLESTKVDLALRRDFNLFDAFKFFDLAEKGSVCKSEIRDALNELGVFPTNDELYLVMRKFDKNNDGLIRFSDFRDMLTPKEGGYTELLNKREPIYSEGAALTDIFSEQTLFLLKKTLNMIIKNEVYSESIRQRLNRRPLFDTWEGFKALDKNNDGYVRAYEFKDMLIDHGFYPSSKEVSNLVDRYDRNQDGKVSYSEFVNEITPKSPQRY